MGTFGMVNMRNPYSEKLAPIPPSDADRLDAAAD
jgi:hypothetical protein